MLNLRTGSRGFSSGSGFGFRGRRARDSDTLGTYSSLVSNSIHALQITHFSHIRIFIYLYSSYTHTFSFFSQFLFFFLWLSTIIFIIFFFNEDVEVNELEDLHSRSHEVDGQYYFFIISAKIKSRNYLYLLYWLQFWCYSLQSCCKGRQAIG